MADIDTLRAEHEQALAAADAGQKAVEEASANALVLAQAAQAAGEALDAALLEGLPEQTPAPEVPEAPAAPPQDEASLEQAPVVGEEG